MAKGSKHGDNPQDDCLLAKYVNKTDKGNQRVRLRLCHGMGGRTQKVEDGRRALNKASVSQAQQMKHSRKMLGKRSLAGSLRRGAINAL